MKEPIILNNYNGSWEVGISSFSYTQEINNFGECMLMEIYLFDGVKTYKIPIEDQLVSSAGDMADALNRAIRKFFNERNVIFRSSKRRINSDDDEIEIQYPRAMKKIKRDGQQQSASWKDMVFQVDWKKKETEFEENVEKIINTNILPSYYQSIMSAIAADTLKLKEAENKSKYLNMYVMFLGAKMYFMFDKIMSILRNIREHGSYTGSLLHNGFYKEVNYETAFKEKDAKFTGLHLLGSNQDVLAVFNNKRTKPTEDPIRHRQNLFAKNLFFITDKKYMADFNSVVSKVNKQENWFSFIKNHVDKFFQSNFETDSEIEEYNKLISLIRELKQWNETCLTSIAKIPMTDWRWFEFASYYYQIYYLILEFETNNDGTLEEFYKNVKKEDLEKIPQESNFINIKEKCDSLMKQICEIIIPDEDNERFNDVFVFGDSWNDDIISFSKFFDLQFGIWESSQYLIEQFGYEKITSAFPEQSLQILLKDMQLLPKDRTAFLLWLNGGKKEKLPPLIMEVDDGDDDEDESMEDPPTASAHINPVPLIPDYHEEAIETNTISKDGLNIQITSAFYGMNERDFNEQYNVYKANPFSISSVNNKIQIRTYVGYFDIAFSPNLIKALGLIPLNKFTLEALNKRNELRHFLGFGKRYSDIFGLDAIFREIYMTGEANFFGKENLVDRYEMYDKANINPYNIKKAIDSGEIPNLEEYITSFVLPKTEYMSIRDQFFRTNDISLIDAMIYRLYSDSLRKGFTAPDVVNLQPSDLAFFYSNIIEPDYVDNGKMRLLDIMPIRSVGLGEKAQIELSNTRYKRVEVNILSEIQILIKTSLGLPVPFRYGPATVQLHFRRR